jgi:hypothetical protein
VWLATTEQQHEGLHREFPNMPSIHLPGKAVTCWQVTPAGEGISRRRALRACDLVLAVDPRIGKVRGRRAAPESLAGAKPHKR